MRRSLMKRSKRLLRKWGAERFPITERLRLATLAAQEERNTWPAKMYRVKDHNDVRLFFAICARCAANTTDHNLTPLDAELEMIRHYIESHGISTVEFSQQWGDDTGALDIFDGKSLRRIP